MNRIAESSCAFSSLRILRRLLALSKMKKGRQIQKNRGEFEPSVVRSYRGSAANSGEIPRNFSSKLYSKRSEFVRITRAGFTQTPHHIF